MSEVTLHGHILVPAADLSAVLAELPNHIALTRGEAGCLSFSVEQDPAHALRFIVSEVFRDAAAFAAHQARVKGSHWGAVTRNVARHYRVTGLDP